MPAWCFKTSDSSGHGLDDQWYWEIESEDTPIAILSSLYFATLQDCIAHAREHGFRGDVDVPETLEYPAVIRCGADDCPPYLLNRSRRGRARRSAR